MKLISWNVNGIRAVLTKGELQKLIATENPDILCLQEIKATKGVVDVDFPQYTEYWNSASRKGYSGTALFSKTPALSVFYNFPEKYTQKYNFVDEYGDTNDEGRIIVAEFTDFFVATVYTPNSKDDLSRIPMRFNNWDKAFLEYMKDLEKTKPVIFCGDFNVAHTEIDLARPKENVGKKGFTDQERQRFSEFISSGFLDSFRIFDTENGNYTWWSNWGGARSRNIGWRIDYFLVSEMLKEKILSAKILDKHMGSDHCPVTLEINF